MARKRKIPMKKIVEEEGNEDELIENENSENSSIQQGPMYNIMSNVQLCETFHNKYIKEMQQLYKKMDHDAFMFTFIKMIKSAMEAEENNEYANTTLHFCAKYISSYQSDITHPVLLDTFKWITSTISTNPHIRYRLCQFVNIILCALGPEAALDDCICDNIMSYMNTRLSDINPNVRVQAILALQRLQNPDNPDDIILKTYQFHLGADPSPKVRMAVISSIGRNFNTIPYILERLWDIDEKVRRHTYLNMSSYPVRSYKVAQRLTFLEQGLNDRSDMVKKVVSSVMLPQWLESYNKDYIELISALKLDANEAEIDRFRKTAKLALKEMFKKGNVEELVKCLPIERDDLEKEFYKCVPHEKLKIEVSIYWICLIEYLQQQMADEIDVIIPELSTFCLYILKFCELRKLSNDDDKWRKMENQYILLGLMEIVYTFDLGDEIGRENLKQLLGTLLKNHDINGKVVEMVVRCAENLITNQEDRLQFFVDIIKEITDTKAGNLNDFLNNRNLIDELLDKNSDINLKLKITSLRVKILDLEEQERNYVDKKDYVEAQKITEEKSACHEEYMNLLKPLLIQTSTSENSDRLKSAYVNLQQPKKITSEEIVKCLQISFYMVASKKVNSLTPNVCELYKNFIRRHIESSTIFVRNWALKCGTAYSMLYDQLAKDVYSELYTQFFKNQNITIWNTSIDCLFELIDRYGFDHFENTDKQNKNKNRRQLYNTLEFLDVDEDVSSTSTFHVDVIFMMSHILDTCEDVYILRAIVKGMCRLVLHGHIKNDDIMEKLLLKYFNPATEPEINQILGMFYRNLIKKKRQEYLQPCLLPTINTILTAPYDSPFHEIKPETVIKFVVDATRPQFCSTGLNIHNTIALSFMQEMQNNLSNKELVKILSKELFSLEISASDDAPLRNDLGKCCDKLLESELDFKSAKNIRSFKEVLNGNFAGGLRVTQDGSEEDEDESDHETQATTETTQSVNINSAPNFSETEPNRDNLKETGQSNQRTENEKGDGSEHAQNALPENSIQGNELVNKEKLEKIPGQNEDNTCKINDRNINSPNAKTPNSTAIEATISKEITQNLTQNVSAIIPPLMSDNSTPRKTISDNTNESAQASIVNHNKSATTFGRDNNTNMRYLRKSLNLRQTSHNNEDGPTMPPKIRIEAKMQANIKGIQEVPQPALESSTTTNKEYSDTSDKNKRSTQINDEENEAINKTATDLSLDLTSEAVAASPEAVINKHGKRELSRLKKNSVSKTKTVQAAVENPKSPASSITSERKQTRSITKNKQDVTILSTAESEKKAYPKTPKPVAPKSNSQNVNSASKALNQSNQKVDAKSKTFPSKNQTPVKVSKQTKTGNTSNENSPSISTRSASKRDHLANAIVTRKRLSDNFSTLKQSIDRGKASRIPVSKNTVNSKEDKSSQQQQNKSNKTDSSKVNKNQQVQSNLRNETEDTIKKNKNLNTKSNLPVRLKSSRLTKK
ncbi:condensin complex subunit 3 isoform X2 [Condylostylus longicornis]|uniref:condensin complex subunit 3 isoform X2 n=1 Tax=Condylostylus longicornis TaxID=2530218 RepID=UPI00244DE560|nr:condensin complex subunit 3 isoform X2 [Condylostylus longicornis]